MRDKNPATDHSDHSEEIKRWLAIGNSVALVLVLFVITVSSVLIFGLRSDVAALEDQARKSAKSAKALQDELASLKERLRMAGPLPGSLGSTAEPRPTNIDAADPANDCVIRPGDKNGLANCIRNGAR